MNPRIILFLVFLVPFLIGCMGGDRFTAHPWSGLAISEDEELLYVSTGDGKLKVFDSDNGKLVAEYPNSDAGDTGIGQFYSSPTVYEDWVFVASYQKDKEKCGTGDKSGTAPCGRIYGLKWIQMLHKEETQLILFKDPQQKDIYLLSLLIVILKH